MLRHFSKLGFVDDLYAEFFGLVELAARFSAGENVIGFFADAAGDFSAGGFDFGGRFFAFQRGKCASEHECFSSELPALGAGSGPGLRLEIEAGRAQSIDQFAISRLLEPVIEALGNNFADVLCPGEFIQGGLLDFIQRGELTPELRPSRSVGVGITLPDRLHDLAR